MLHFSLDSPIREEHNAMRGVACYDSVLESIRVARSLGERPDILFTVFDHNIGHIETIWKNICLPDNLVLILNPVFEYNAVQTGGGLSESSLTALSWWGKQKNVYLNEAFITLRRNGGNDTAKPVCRAASSTIVISPDNHLVLPCYHLGLKTIPIGDNLYEVFQSAEVKYWIEQEGRLPQCQGCAINCYMQPSLRSK